MTASHIPKESLFRCFPIIGIFLWILSKFSEQLFQRTTVYGYYWKMLILLRLTMTLFCKIQVKSKQTKKFCNIHANKVKSKQTNNFCNIQANKCMFRVNNRNSRKRCEIYLKLTVKTPDSCQWYRSDIFIVNFEHISHLFRVFLLLTLNK